MTQMARVDVIIIGAGPAGLMAAAWMARTGIKTLLVEQKSSCTRAGRADGLEGRTLEILDSFGLATSIWAESNHTIEIALWCDSVDGPLQRRSISANTKPGWSRFHESTLGQARIEEHLLKFLRDHEHIDIRQSIAPKSLEVDLLSLNDPNAYPIQVTLDHSPPLVTPREAEERDPVSPNGSETSRPDSALSHDSTYAEIGHEVRAKYLLGCDGARSWVRKQLGFLLEGENLGQDWAAMDFVPATNFSDIRKRCIVKSKFGSLMIIPREKKMIRAYVQISAETAVQYRLQQDASIVMQDIEAIMQPYHIKALSIDWCTIYKVGQRVCSKFSYHNRIFLAGDAVHTHSPKAGQGMNVSMQDTYNLGWKLASVIHGVSPSNILHTYQEERLPVAERLLRLDRRVCRGLCGSITDTNGQFDEDYKRALEEENTSASGLAVTYQPNLLVTPTSHVDGTTIFSKPSLATNIQVGARIPSELVLNQSDSQAYHLQQLFPSIGQWNLVVFGGDISDPIQMERVHQLGKYISCDESYIAQLNQDKGRSGPVGSIGIYLIHSAERHSIDLFQLPSAFCQYTEEDGMEYDKVFADNKSYHSGGGRVYASFGISSEGCMVLLRPDQHVAFLGSLEDVKPLEGFVATFLHRRVHNKGPNVEQ